ncbi:MAG: hypothetical protein ABI355_02530 [Solirubrobacteraceae bacterium]
MALTRTPVTTDPQQAAEVSAPEAPIETPAGPNGPSHEVSRRSFLHRGAVAGGTALVVVTGGVGYRAYDEGVFQVGQGGAYEAWRSWNQQRGPMALVAAAILAANPHNTQAWIFRVSPQRIDLFADRSRNIGAVDPFRREMYVGLGCAIENLILAAGPNGYQTKLTLLPTPGQPVHAAAIELSRGPVRRPELYAQIPNRHTDRTAYQLRPVPTAAQRAMSALAADLPDTGLHWITGATERGQIGALMVAAAQALTEDRQQSVDDNRWFRHDWDAIQRLKDGLTIDAQGLPALTSTLAKLIPATSRQYNDNFWVNHTRDPQARTAAAYGIISVPDAQNDHHRLNGGRLLERIHLWTAGHGLSLGHMNQITERADRERQLGATPTFGNATRELVTARGTEQLVAFRIGYPATGDGRRLSPRRPTTEVTR